MIKLTELALLLFVSSLALADNGGDAVNERIPVNKAALEDHWQVDCAGAWARLQAATTRPSMQDHCEISAGLVREIKLCAFIYQAPGETSRHKGPDYRGVSQLLEQSGDMAECPWQSVN
jgi:hypothetical protein